MPLTQKLTSEQIKANIDTLFARGANREAVQKYVNHYQQDTDGSFVLKTDMPQEAPPEPKGFFRETLGDIKQIGTGIKEQLGGLKEKTQEIGQATRQGEQGFTRGLFQTLGAAAGATSGIIGEAVIGAGKAVLPQGAEDTIKRGVEKVVGAAIETEPAQKFIGTMQRLEQENPALARDLQAVLGFGQLGLDIAGFGLGAEGASRGVSVVKNVAKEGIETATETAAKVGGVARDVTKRLVKATETPPPSALEAGKQILQGKPKDIAKGIRGLAEVDTSTVTSFEGLLKQVDKRIPELAKQVDADLALDTTKRQLADLNLSVARASGEPVTISPVKQALTQLEELYTKTNDPVKLADIKDIVTRAESEGLTNLEINDIARAYGAEFRSKGFSKTGEALTSVNAQAFQNTRNQLKTLARQGIKGEEARMADQAMTNLYKTQELIQKNVEAVNKLKQRIQKRGLLEKVGHGLTKALNTISGGSVRGVVGGLLPRGVGNKVMNDLDLEEALVKNLKVFEQALASKSDTELLKILKPLEKQSFGNGAVRQTAKETMETTIPKIKGVSDDLIKEARKYKNAEEFVKAQGTPVYHGTNNANVIEKQGLKAGSGETSGSGGTLGKGIYLSGDKSLTKLYGSNVVNVVIAPNAKIKSFNVQELIDFKKGLTGEQLKNKIMQDGFDGLRVVNSKGITEDIVVYKDNLIKTKSQLTDIWNKANRASSK